MGVLRAQATTPNVLVAVSIASVGYASLTHPTVLNYPGTPQREARTVDSCKRYPPLRRSGRPIRRPGRAS